MSEAQLTSAAAIVECILRRPPHGTKIELGGKVYHFKPDETGRETALIDDVEHLGKLLSIPEAYKLFSVASREPATALGIVNTGVAAQPAPEPAPQPVPIPEIAPAPLPPEQSANTIAPQGVTSTGEAPKDPLDHDGDGKKGGSLPDNGEADETPADLVGKSIDDLRLVFKEEVGRTANLKAKPETLIAQIVARRKELAGA